MSDESPETLSREAAPRRYKGLPPSGPCSRLLHLCDREDAAQEDGFVGHVLRDRCGALDRARVNLLCGTWTLRFGEGGERTPADFSRVVLVLETSPRTIQQNSTVTMHLVENSCSKIVGGGSAGSK